MTPALVVGRPGPRTTVQDRGRLGLAHLGVPTAGPVDPARHAVANAIAGNSPDAAALEVTLGGFVAEAAGGDLTVAVVGIDPVVDVDGQRVDAGCALPLAAGQTVRVSGSSGLYVYVAIAGGIDVAPVLGSRSTDTLTGIGPPVLSAGEALPVGASTWRRPERIPAAGGSVGAVTVRPGPHLDLVGPAAYEDLVAGEWRVSTASDRTAVRLDGPPIASSVAEMASEGLFPGAVQLPPSGQPTVFLANHPVTGGYPVIGVIPGIDLATVVQSRPGVRVRLRRAG